MLWLLVFFLTPIAEMYLLIEVAGYINTWPTIGLVMLTAVIGVALLKRQGVATLTRGMSRMNAGEVPAREMAEGILLAVAGALLITPGFVTDTVGFVLLFPPSRMAIAAQMLQRVQVQTVSAMHGHSHHHSGPSPAPGSGQTAPDSQRDNVVTLEGEYERK